tara:strand:+ start:3819 stop:4649 length:831 start_codon:yes stop_codon:yes gene_type:complete
MAKEVKYGYRPVAVDVGTSGGGATQKASYTDLHFFSLDQGSSVSFPAIITDFNDSYQSSWNEEEVYGRMDPISIFKSTRRSMSVGFQIAAQSLEASTTLQTNLNKLIQLLYPSYVSVGGIKLLKGAPLFRIKFGNLITNSNSGLGTAEDSGLPGYIRNFSNSPELDVGFMGTQKTLHPKIWNISFDFQVLHDQTPGFVNKKFMIKKNGLDYPYGAAEKGAVEPTRSNANGKDPSRLGRQRAVAMQAVILTSGNPLLGAALAGAADAVNHPKKESNP